MHVVQAWHGFSRLGGGGGGAQYTNGCSVRIDVGLVGLLVIQVFTRMSH